MFNIFYQKGKVSCRCRQFRDLRKMLTNQSLRFHIRLRMIWSLIIGGRIQSDQSKVGVEETTLKSILMFQLCYFELFYINVIGLLPSLEDILEPLLDYSFLWFWYFLWIYLVIKSETYRSKNSFAFCNQFFFMQQFVIYFVENVINFTTLTSNGFK